MTLSQRRNIVVFQEFLKGVWLWVKLLYSQTKNSVKERESSLQRICSVKQDPLREETAARFE